MFCVYDDEEHVIAFHDYLDVVQEYVDNVKKSHENVNLHIGKIKRKKVKNLQDFYDLYLVRYGETYVQEGYMEYLSLVTDQVDYDNKLAIDILMRTLEDPRTTKKERQIMERAVYIMNRLAKEDATYTPTLKNLKDIKNEFDPYIYNHGSYNDM